MTKISLTAAASVIGLAISAPAGLSPTPVHAAEVKVLSAVAVKSALDELAGSFERATGNKLTVSYATAGEVVKRIAGGESADIVILPKPRLDELAQQSKIAPESATGFASAVVGVAVRTGAPKPDIGSPDALKRSLLAAKSISYADPAKGGASGIHFVRVLDRLGI